MSAIVDFSSHNSNAQIYAAQVVRTVSSAKPSGAADGTRTAPVVDF